MQQDLDRLQKRKRIIQRIAFVLLLSLAVAFMMFTIRSCSDQYDDPYNKDYRPVDVTHQHSPLGSG